MKLFEITVKSKSGNNVVLYFETKQGSKYILTDKNESKRIKSVHSNADDSGLKDWYQKCVFVDEKSEKAANAFQFLVDKFEVFLFAKGNAITLATKENGKFRNLKMSDAFPKAVSSNVLKDGDITFQYSTKPVIGQSVVEFNVESSGKIKSYHFGSPVSKIKKIDELSQSELMSFKDK